MKYLSKYFDGCLKFLMCSSSFYAKWNVVFLIFGGGVWFVLIEVTTSSKSCATFLPSICHQMTIAWSSPLLKMIIYIFSFSGHPPKTGSVANFLSLDLSVLDNAVTLLFTLKWTSAYLFECPAERKTKYQSRQPFGIPFTCMHDRATTCVNRDFTIRWRRKDKGTQKSNRF